MRIKEISLRTYWPLLFVIAVLILSLEPWKAEATCNLSLACVVPGYVFSAAIVALLPAGLYTIKLQRFRPAELDFREDRKENEEKKKRCVLTYTFLDSERGSAKPTTFTPRNARVRQVSDLRQNLVVAKSHLTRFYFDFQNSNDLASLSVALNLKNTSARAASEVGISGAKTINVIELLFFETFPVLTSLLFLLIDYFYGYQLGYAIFAISFGMVSFALFGLFLTPYMLGESKSSEYTLNYEPITSKVVVEIIKPNFVEGYLGRRYYIVSSRSIRKLSNHRCAIFGWRVITSFRCSTELDLWLANIRAIEQSIN